jgi:hypothetical protein
MIGDPLLPDGAPPPDPEGRLSPPCEIDRGGGASAGLEHATKPNDADPMAMTLRRLDLG